MVSIICHCAQRLCRWVWLCSLSAQHAVSLVHGFHVCALLCLLHNLWRNALWCLSLLQLLLLALEALQQLVGKWEVAMLK